MPGKKIYYTDQIFNKHSLQVGARMTARITNIIQSYLKKHRGNKGQEKGK